MKTNKKNQKKSNPIKFLITLMTMLILISGLSFAEDMEFTPKIEVTDQNGNFFSKLFQAFVVTGGDTNQDKEVIKGTVLSGVKLTVKVKEDINGFCKKSTGTTYQYTNKFALYWYLKDTGEKKTIGTFYIKNNYDVGDYFNVKFSNLDTAKIPDSWLNKLVRVGATHYVCQADYLGHGSKGMFFGKWVMDNTHYGADRSTNDDFTIIDENNECKKKYIRTICEDNAVKKEYQTVWTDSDGECGRQYTTTDHCSMTEECKSGKCVTKANPEPKCSLKNLYVINLDGTLTACMKEGVGYCDDGVCKIPKDDGGDDQGGDGGNSQGGDDDGDECECEEGESLTAKCEDGSDTTLFECDGCYMQEVEPECVVNEQEDPRYNNANGDYEPDKTFWQKYQMYIGISSAIILLGGAYLFMFNPFKKKSKRKRK